MQQTKNSTITLEKGKAKSLENLKPKSLVRKKVIIAVGGTAGHLFPAQAIASELLEKAPKLKLLFSGAKLQNNPYFKKSLFSFKEISSSTLFKKNPFKILVSIFVLMKGIKQSFSLFQEFSPDLLVGFGSFHSFPLLFAARLKKIPYILFSSDSIPGKVNRFFSKNALVSAIQFEQAKAYISGKSVLVDMPFIKSEDHWMHLTVSDAKRYFGLDPNLPVLLVFGGSLGAQTINRLIPTLPLTNSFQVLHFTGNEQMTEELIGIYKKQKIAAHVKTFEDRMQIAWKAATIALCRCGASTFAEILAYEVPSILIPYPFAADGHQEKNAEILEKNVKGGICIPEEKLSKEKIVAAINNLVTKLEEMKKNIASYKKANPRQQLSKIILDYLSMNFTTHSTNESIDLLG